jgi:hypothetical protein
MNQSKNRHQVLLVEIHGNRGTVMDQLQNLNATWRVVKEKPEPEQKTETDERTTC